MVDSADELEDGADYVAPPNDHLQRFLFESRPLRGALVHVRDGWAALQGQREYPEPMRDLLGRAFAAAALMASTIKFEGRMNLQLQGSGPVSLLLVQVDHNLHMRGVLRHSAESDDPAEPNVTDVDVAAPAPATRPGVTNIRELTGDARLALMIDPLSGKSRYQTLVELSGSTLAESLASYFDRSEQLPTWFLLSADETGVAGLMLQRLPVEEDDREAAEQLWELSLQEAQNLTDQQLLSASGPDVLSDVFGDEELRVFRPRAVDLGCRCSHGSISEMLLGLGRQETESIIADVGRVEVECGFCGTTYNYDLADIEQLFNAAEAPPPTPSQH